MAAAAAVLRIGKGEMAVPAADREKKAPDTPELAAPTEEMAAPERLLEALGRGRRRQPLALAREPSILAVVAAAIIGGQAGPLAESGELMAAGMAAAQPCGLEWMGCRTQAAAVAAVALSRAIPESEEMAAAESS